MFTAQFIAVWDKVKFTSRTGDQIASGRPQDVHSFPQ